MSKKTASIGSSFTPIHFFPISLYSNLMDDDEESKEELASTPDLNRSRNKRKNFKPRNILSDTAKAAMNLKKNLLMPQKRDNSPMDLSVQGMHNFVFISNNMISHNKFFLDLSLLVMDRVLIQNLGFRFWKCYGFKASFIRLFFNFCQVFGIFDDF